jgi:hypothetical protein
MLFKWISTCSKRNDCPFGFESMYNNANLSYFHSHNLFVFILFRWFNWFNGGIPMSISSTSCRNGWPRKAGCLVLALVLAIILAGRSPAPASAASPCHVKDDAGGANDGSTWTDAYTDLQSALGDAACTEIWVAAGIYKPTSGTDRSATFQLKNGVALYGGFAGTEVTRAERDNWHSNWTVLSGDIGTEIEPGDNAYTVVNASGTDATTILDGFSIYEGNADCNCAGGGIYIESGSPTLANLEISMNHADWGGGVFNNAGSPSLTNVSFYANSATNYGGGMMNDSGSHPSLVDVIFSSNNNAPFGGGMANNFSDPSLVNVTFSNNTAATSGGGMFNYASSPTLATVTFTGNTAGWGGGMYNEAGSTPTLAQVTFSSNTATEAGGGMYNNASDPDLSDILFGENSAKWGGGMFNDNSSPSLDKVTFSGNSATDSGGGLDNSTSSPVITNVTFTGNTAANNGGGMVNEAGSAPQLTNLTFFENSAVNNGGGVYNLDGSPVIRNNIFWGNTAAAGAQVTNDGTSAPTITFSDVDGGYSGTGNINSDPFLGDLGYYGSSTLVLPLLSGSPAINAGEDATCAATDQRGLIRPQGTHCDMGALEIPQLTGILYVASFDTTNLLCSSWSDTCDLQYALSVAAPGAEIWVQTGTYAPTTGTNRSKNFRLNSGVGTYGGFIGTETARDQRNPSANPVTLSGDIGTAGDSSDNSYNVVVGIGVDTTAVLDGFTISGGNADCTCAGGGIYLDDSSPALTNLHIENNAAGWGGGIFTQTGSPLLADVGLSGNTATYSGGGMEVNGGSPSLTNAYFSMNSAGDNGGGMEAIGPGSPSLTDVTFSGNSAAQGGGVLNDGSTSTFTNVLFKDNTASGNGGGMGNNASNPTMTGVAFKNNSAALGGGTYNDSGSPVITNAAWVDNTATDGGAIYNNAGSPSLTNATFGYNSAGRGGGVFSLSGGTFTLANVTLSDNAATLQGGGLFSDASSLIVRNAILWGNTAPAGAQIFTNSGTPPVITYSDVEGGYTGAGNLSLIPLLGSQAVYNGLPLFPLLAGSPAIDAGQEASCASTDQRGIARPQGLHCDMGAFEWKGASRIYAAPAGLTTGTCAAWASACELRYALNLTSVGSEVWVQAGTYTPTAGGNRMASFQVNSGVAVYGGFAGTETALDQRDFSANLTFLSGDIGIPGFIADNSLHVVDISGADVAAVLDGVIIHGGNANIASVEDAGGGITNIGGNPSLNHLMLINNMAAYGGGMYNLLGNPILYDVIFDGNTGSWGGGMFGFNSSPSLAGVTFQGNHATYGGGMYNNSLSSPSLDSVTFAGNTASYGGGMYNNLGSNPSITNVTFVGNSVSSVGGGLVNNDSSPMLTNSTLSQNSSFMGGGMYNYGGSEPVIRNTIFWGNTSSVTSITANGHTYYPSQVMNNIGSSSSSTFLYSVLQLGCQYSDTCSSLVTTNPLLGGLDYYGGSTQVFPIQTGSPAMDTGQAASCAATDQRGVPRPQGPGCDMGAYEQVKGFLFARPGGYTSITPGGACNSWANACELRFILSIAGYGTEIWAAQGTYLPTGGTDRSAAFPLQNWTSIYGGFNGTETARNQRDPAANPTILSGDIGVPGDATDNSLTVVNGSNTDATALLDGFTITGGHADCECAGGGMVVENGGPTLTDLVFSDNLSGWGGGMFSKGGSPSLMNVTFTGNTAIYSGGGMQNTTSSPSLTKVTFSGNTAGDNGGGIENYDSSNPMLTNVTFTGNNATAGGGLYNNSNSNPNLTNVTFSGNSADTGGAVFNNTSSPVFTNVTFGNNSAVNGGGSIYNFQSSPIIRDSILWEGTVVNEDAGSAPNFQFSILQDGCPAHATCSNIRTTDPVLGALGFFGGKTPVLPLLPGSAAIDNGNNATCAGDDQRGVTRPKNGICDLGAFESQSFALTITDGNNQHAAINTTFAQPLAVSVGGTNGDPVNGGIITFTAPASGVSAVLSSTSVMISGLAASVNASTNGIAGSYDVNAYAAGVVVPAEFHLTNDPEVATDTPTFTPSPTTTVTGTQTFTPTNTPTTTVTATPTGTRTPTVTYTQTFTPTTTASATATSTGTITITITYTPTQTATVTQTSTTTATSTHTPIGTISPTLTFTRTFTSTSTWTPTATSTYTYHRVYLPLTRR